MFGSHELRRHIHIVSCVRRHASTYPIFQSIHLFLLARDFQTFQKLSSHFLRLSSLPDEFHLPVIGERSNPPAENLKKYGGKKRSVQAFAGRL